MAGGRPSLIELGFVGRRSASVFVDQATFVPGSAGSGYSSISILPLLRRRLVGALQKLSQRRSAAAHGEACLSSTIAPSLIFAWCQIGVPARGTLRSRRQDFYRADPSAAEVVIRGRSLERWPPLSKRAAHLLIGPARRCSAPGETEKPARGILGWACRPRTCGVSILSIGEWLSIGTCSRVGVMRNPRCVVVSGHARRSAMHVAGSSIERGVLEVNCNRSREFRSDVHRDGGRPAYVGVRHGAQSGAVAHAIAAAVASMPTGSRRVLAWVRTAGDSSGPSRASVAVAGNWSWWPGATKASMSGSSRLRSTRSVRNRSTTCVLRLVNCPLCGDRISIRRLFARMLGARVGVQELSPRSGDWSAFTRAA